MTVFIDFEPVGRRGECQSGVSLLECARRLGIDLVNLCGGLSNCGCCVVQVLDGRVSEPTDGEREHLCDEEISQGYRLACQAIPFGDCKIHIPAESLPTPQRIHLEGEEIQIHPEPAVKCYRLELSHPSLGDLRADAERLMDAFADQIELPELTMDFAVLQDLSLHLREMGWQINALVRDKEIIALLPPGARPLGLAVDLGTTKIAVYLVDLESGGTLASQGIMNPQIAFGEDIITRIAYAQREPAQAKLLQEKIVEALNQVVIDLCDQTGARLDEIIDVVAVGNTAMHHLFLGLPVKQLGRAPYLPAVSSALDLKARDLGLRIARGAYVHLLPNIAGYVGADHVAMLLATEMVQAEGVVLAIDIGTNTEVCLVDNGKFMSLSTASGPAFEGAHIKHGIRAMNGAIERLRLVDGQVEYLTIGDGPPVGICGSGILDALAQLFLAGVVNPRGRLGEHPRVRKDGEQREFVIVEQRVGESFKEDITLTQKDIQELLLAKGAIRTGINVLLQANERTPDEVDQIIIAGAFGTYLNVSSAMTIGMLPELPLERVRQVGNAAGMGAKLALISKSKREEAKKIADRIRYIELAADPQFSKTFAKAMYLGQ